MKLAFLLMAVLMTSACASNPESLCENEALYDTASKFSDLTQKVDAEYKFGDVSGKTPGEVLKKVSMSDAAYQQILSDYDVELKVTDANAVMMMCSASKRIIQDAGCTSKVEEVLACGERAQCRFTLDANEVCSQLK